MYYNKLIKRNKLIKYWLFFGGALRLNFKLNFNFFSVIYNLNLYSNLNKLIFSIKNVIPLFLSISYAKGNIVFVASKWVYSKIIYNKTYLCLVKELMYQQPGIFSNFSRISDFCFKKLNFNKNPSVLVFFFFKEKDYLILEAKKKNTNSWFNRTKNKFINSRLSYFFKF